MSLAITQADGVLCLVIASLVLYNFNRLTRASLWASVLLFKCLVSVSAAASLILSIKVWRHYGDFVGFASRFLRTAAAAHDEL